MPVHVQRMVDKFINQVREAMPATQDRVVVNSSTVFVEGLVCELQLLRATILAKGLEFRGVVVMARDDEIIPSQERIETVGDDADLEEVYNTERHLLYVACTRARDHLPVCGVEPASEFLDDLQRNSQPAKAVP
ncbi:MAG TPA: 3'-5' exonuclease [Bryobacteraceae bacterium]|jgi:superfamily I DNA/RNA helicase